MKKYNDIIFIAKKYFKLILIASFTFANIYIFSRDGSVADYFPSLIICTCVFAFIYILTAFPISLVLNKRKKRYSIIDLIVYLIGSLLTIIFFDNSFLASLANLTWHIFMIKLTLWSGAALSFWFWNSIFILKNGENEEA